MSDETLLKYLLSDEKYNEIINEITAEINSNIEQPHENVELIHNN